MAAWGAGTFDNEDAQLWLPQLAQLTDNDLTTILSRSDSDDYLEAGESAVMIAAAEAVSAWHGAPCESPPAAILQWAQRHTTAPPLDVTALAARAVQKVRTNSELKDLWLEADGLNEWSAALRDLETRLAG
jgi:hypothetical protein